MTGAAVYLYSGSGAKKVRGSDSEPTAASLKESKEHSLENVMLLYTGDNKVSQNI